jgi:competence protein ComEC
LVVSTYGVLLLLLVTRRARSDPTRTPRPRRAPLVHGVTLLRITSAALVAIAWTGWTILPAGQGTGHAFHVLAAGNGGAMLLATPNGSAAVFDVGTDTNSDVGEATANALRALGIRRVDAVVISHGNIDHYSGLPTLMRRIPVERWLTNAHFAGQDDPRGPLQELLGHLPRRDLLPAALHAGDSLQVGDVELDVLWPPADLDETWSVNDRSLVLRADIRGCTVLLTGDIETSALSALLAAEREGRVDLKADVLIAPHHGQVIPRVTADFLAAVAPRVVIASTRTPRPKLEALVAETLGEVARALLTVEAGAVVVRVGPDGQFATETPYEPRTRR